MFDFNKSPQSLAFFLFIASRVRGERDVAPKKGERTRRKQRDSRDFRTDCRKRHKKRDNACSEKSKTKNFSRFFSPELSRVLSSVAFGRYESYLINNLFLLQEESFHDERRREKGKFRSYCIYHRVVVESFSSFSSERFKSKSESKRERARLDLPFFAAA